MEMKNPMSGQALLDRVSEIPTVSLHSLLDPVSLEMDVDASSESSSSSSTNLLYEAVASIRHACLTVGFFYIKDHGVSDAVMQNAFDAIKKFFAQPTEEKRRLDATQSPLYRGYNAIEDGKHNCKRTEGYRDAKESFVIGMTEQHGSSPMHGANQWPEENDELKSAIEPYFEAVRKSARAVARGLAMAIDLPENYFLERLREPVAQMVMLRYQALHEVATNSEDKWLGCGPHTDCGFLTLLAQDSQGLDVFTGGEWVCAPSKPGHLLVNLGDMAAYWSEKASVKLKSTLHRVTNGTHARHSLVVFMNPDFEASMDIPDEHAGDFVERKSSGEYRSAGHYLLSRLGLMWLDDKS